MGADSSGGVTARRSGEQTRREAQRIALELFTAQGYDATSLRQIAEALDITKASLYYHFPSKEAILRSSFADRTAEIERLLQWVRAQPRTPEVLEAAVLRWVGLFSTDKLRGIRFMTANPLVVQAVGAADGQRIGFGLVELIEELIACLPSPTPADTLLLRLAVLSVNNAVTASTDMIVSDEDVVAVAVDAARTLVRHLVSRVGGGPAGGRGGR